MRILFSHVYGKFFESINGVKIQRVYANAEAQLLEVFTVDKGLSPAYVEDDTLIYSIDPQTREHYALTDGILLVLLFKTKEGFMFTTIRRHTPEKEAYYREARGQVFTVVIKK